MQTTRKRRAIGLLLGGLSALGACASSPPAAPPAPAGASPSLVAEIRRTAFGTPHIKAQDIAGIGYGFGYASAEDNLCDIMDRYMTVRAERARSLGPGADDANVLSDLYHQRMIDSQETERLLAGPAGSVDTPSADARALVRGYVAGVNRRLADIGGAAGVSDRRCRGAAWVKPLTEIEYWRHMFVGQTIDAFIAPTTEAAPPNMSARTDAMPALAADPQEEPAGHGSNAYGLGRDVTKSGMGMLLGNPHYPWDGPNRFYRAHFTIPGKLNVVGVSYVGMPLIRMGHTEWVAWSNTVSTARRFGYYELELDPSDPTRYRIDGQFVPMERAQVTVEVKRGGDVAPETRTLFSTRWGPVIASKTFPWTQTRAFALRTPRVGLRDVDQYMAVWQARNVRQLRDVLAARQSYRFNTTAVDAAGETFFGDMGLIPHVTPELAERCLVSDLARQQWRELRIPVLDGSKTACDWGRDPDSSAPGVFGASRAPNLFRTDYVTQSNDSYWLTNPEQPLVGFSPVWGDEGARRSLRTRLGLLQVQQRVAGTDGLGPPKFDLLSLQQVMLGNRHYGAELVRDNLVSACRAAGTAKLAPACDVLAKWDLKVELDSRGAHLFHLFAEAGGLRFADAFDPKDPVNTPRKLDTSDPAVLAALETAVDQLTQLQIPLDARLGEIQRETRSGQRIPVHGGAGPEGVFNVITVEQLEPELGWTSIRHGASWVMAMGFTPEGPVSTGFLTYSQSGDPDSPHHVDQLRLYERKEWDDLRFSEAAVEAGTLSRKTIEE